MNLSKLLLEYRHIILDDIKDHRMSCIVNLSKLLLEYRHIILDEIKDHRMSCIVNLLVSYC